jgi:hypothetical protein
VVFSGVGCRDGEEEREAVIAVVQAQGGS